MKRTYFLDNNISPGLAVVLRDVLHETAVALREEFPTDTADEDWIPVVAAKGWVILTVDHKIKSRPAERAAVIESKAIMFFIADGFIRLNKFQQISAIGTMSENIIKHAEVAQPGQLFQVTVNGKVKLITEKI